MSLLEKITKKYYDKEIIISVLKEMQKNNETSYKDFINRIRIRKITKYEIFIPIFNLFDNLSETNFIINEINLEIINSKRIIKFINDLDIKIYPKKYIKVCGESESLKKLWIDKIEEVFNLFRGIIEFNFQNHKFNLFDLGNQSNINRAYFKHPIDFIYTENGVSKKNAFSYQRECKYSERRINNDDLIKIRKYLRIFNKKYHEKSIISLIGSSFRLYISALDIEYDFSCFLSFWQLIEGIALGESIGGNTQKITERIKCITGLLKYQNYNIADTIDLFSIKRNRIAHNGECTVDDLDINILRFLCEIAIKWLIYNKNKIKTIEELDIYYKSISITNESLSKQNKIIKMILNNRK